MNKYENDPDEFERVTRTIKSGPMRVDELSRYMLFQDMGAYARTLGLTVGRLREPQLAARILNRLLGVPKPAPTTPDKPAENQPWCDCENPDQLTFWAHAREGLPVNFHIDMKDAPAIDGYTIDSVYQQAIFWADLSNGGLKVAKVDDKKKANVTIRHADLKGNTLGVTIKRHYENGRMVSAEIIVDSKRDWTAIASNALASILLTVRHEVGHGLGAPHTLDPADILYPSPTEKNIHRAAGPGDTAWIRVGYPAAGMAA